MLYKDEKFSVNKRNKEEDYSNTFGREELIEEIKIIFEMQIKLGSNLATPYLKMQA